MEKLLKNYLKLTENQGWYKPVRFTEKQFKVYEVNEMRRVRSNIPSAVHLAFYTKAKTIKIEYKLGDKARDWAFFDLIIDGVMTQSIEVINDFGVVEFTLSGNDKVKNEIYLPHLVGVEIKMPKADEELIPVVEDKKLWLALGDSITQGMVSKHPSFTYPVIVSRHLGYDLLNCGVGGISFNADELDYIGKEPDLITIALGCNDWDKFDSNEVEKQVTLYVEKLISLYTCRNIYGILPIYRSDLNEVKHGATFTEHREVIKKVYEKYDFIKVLDGFKFVPHDNEFFDDPIELQVHPSDKGFLCYSLGLISAIK